MLDRFGSVDSVPWTRLQPNDDGEWAEQSDPKFGTFLPLGNKDDAQGQVVFGVYTLGVVTNRDPWVSNYSKSAVAHSVQKLIEQYRADSRKYAAAVKGLNKKEWPDVEGYITTDSKRISWTRSLKASLKRQKKLEFVEEAIVRTAYRPFAPRWLYFSRALNEMVYQVPKLFPTFDLHEEAKRLVMEPGDYKVTKMAFAKKDGNADRSAIVFNENLVLRGIPLQAYDYTVAGKSAIEWVMEMYQVKVDPESQIRNDPNAWFGNAIVVVLPDADSVHRNGALPDEPTDTRSERLPFQHPARDRSLLDEHDYPSGNRCDRYCCLGWLCHRRNVATPAAPDPAALRPRLRELPRLPLAKSPSDRRR